ncbi:MAG: tetratricopeptide repeat protein, partial [Gemmatimonadales bacterium]
QFGAMDLEPTAAESAALDGTPLMELPADATPEEVVAAENEAAQNLEFMDLGEVEAPTAPTARDLESRLKKDKEDWEAHRMLGEALLEKGDRDKGIKELETSAEGFAEAEDLASAMAVVEEILMLDKNSIVHQQKRVELAYRQGDRAKLVDAYVELADALLRSDAPDKSIAVYQRVLEHDPDNVRARSALETLAPPEPPRKAEVRPSAKPAPAAAPAGDYVDLGSFLLDDEEQAPVMDTRMRIQDEEPTGDEQKDFQQMLSAFKKGIDANVAEEDFQSHYDLGVAYKEMGLLDEAIAEFQKALRAPDGKLKSSEALGLCFFEKGQYAVTETILKRGIEFAAKGDSERVGVLYWLGRTLEEQGKQAEALATYNRVFVVDINFQDVNQRVQALARASV